MGASIKDPKKKCIFVVGPTASGKSAWALEMARKYNGSIVNIDSVQFYKGLLIGSAAPTEAEKMQAPHYLYSYVDAPREMTAGEYLKDFYALTQTDIKFPLFIVGGTGFYIQALEKGMFNVEPIPEHFRKDIEEELASKGPGDLFDELMLKDPNSKIHINDHYRLVRAIEIIRYTGQIPSELKANPETNKNEFAFDYIKVGFNFEKNVFEGNVKSRTEKMIEAGIVEETLGFKNQGFENWAPLNSVGYKETLKYLREGKSQQWLSEAITQSTMKLIKKQKTWFRRDNTILWSNQSDSLSVFLS
ncbi:MAG: tRNA (adenosine(37)-N6)-dimethylallyltransferase MiaA [Pseudobdellovibrio sp.]